MTERITAYALMEQLNMQDNIQKQKWIFTLRMDHSHCDAALLRTAVFRILSGSDCPDCIINRHR